jgi:cytochrome c peroxidase
VGDRLVSHFVDRLPDVRGVRWRRYVTTPLRALFDTKKIHKGGFYHDGRFADLDAVVRHYEKLRSFSLTDQERGDLIEYLKSL